jgi:hypothetical protein
MAGLSKACKCGIEYSAAPDEQRPAAVRGGPSRPARTPPHILQPPPLGGGRGPAAGKGAGRGGLEGRGRAARGLAILLRTHSPSRAGQTAREYKESAVRM